MCIVLAFKRNKKVGDIIDKYWTFWGIVLTKNGSMNEHKLQVV
jgi:hypothetical protein